MDDELEQFEGIRFLSCAERTKYYVRLFLDIYTSKSTIWQTLSCEQRRVGVERLGIQGSRRLIKSFHRSRKKNNAECFTLLLEKLT